MSAEYWKHRAERLEAALREAIDLMHKNLGAYKSEMPMVAEEIEQFLDKYDPVTGMETFAKSPCPLCHHQIIDGKGHAQGCGQTGYGTKGEQDG